VSAWTVYSVRANHGGRLLVVSRSTNLKDARAAIAKLIDDCNKSWVMKRLEKSSLLQAPMECA